MHNDREKARKATVIIEMRDGKTTGIRDPSNMSAEPKAFTFDFSYWSHDGFKTRGDGYMEKENPKYADQVEIAAKTRLAYESKTLICRCKFLMIWGVVCWKTHGKGIIVVYLLTVKQAVENLIPWLDMV